MSLRLYDNFDSGVTADLADRWTVGGSPTISAGNGRNATACLRMNNTTYSLTRTLDAQATWVVGSPYKISTLQAGTICTLLDAGTAQCALILNVDGTLSVVRGTATAVTGGTSTNAILAGTYYFIEFKVTIADSISASSCKVRVNGVDWITVATGQDMKATANATANQVRLNCASTTGNTTDFDEVYICDGTGSVNNDFLGDVKTVTGRPTGAGATTAWTPSAGANWECVDDAAPDDDATYTESTTVGQVDTFAVPALTATPTAIHGVQVSFNVKKTDAGTASVAAVLRSGGTDYFGTTVALGTTYAYVTHIWETDPATGLAWTRAGVDASEPGYKYIS